jgi:hypothetical protein
MIRIKPVDGFIAQDIEKLMVDLGIPFGGLKSETACFRSLASDFAVPLVIPFRNNKSRLKHSKKQVQTADWLDWNWAKLLNKVF